MSARWLVLGVAFLTVAAQPLLADDAKRRGGGTSSGAGAGHHSSHGSSASSGGSHSSHPSGGSPSGAPVLTDAQRRHPRAGTGTGWRSGGYYGHSPRYPYYGHGYGYGYGRGYYGYGYPSYWGYGYYPWSGLYFDTYWGGPAYYSGGGYYGHSHGGTGSVRVLVDQSKAKVYVDGYYAGIVDDFDGIFQRLNVAPGHCQITVKLEGFKTHTFETYVAAGSTVKLHWDMEEGVGDDGTGDPTLSVQARRSGGGERYGREVEDQPYDDEDAPSDENRWPRDEDRSDRVATQQTGSIRLSIRPDDASVYVDGEFRGNARELRSLLMPAGSHRIEIVRPGYRTLERDVAVEAGQSLDLTVNLER